MGVILDFKNWMKIHEAAESMTAGNNGKAAFDKIDGAMSGPGTDEQGVYNGVMMLKTQADYDACLKLV